MSQRVIRVPLAVDAQVRVPIGPFQLPLRAVFLIAAFSPLALLSLLLGFMPASWRVGLALVVLTVASAIAAPMDQGIWVGTLYIYRYASMVMPNIIAGGSSRRGLVRLVGSAVHISHVKEVSPSKRKLLASLQPLTRIPVPSTAAPGILVLEPGGARAVLCIDGPTVSIATDAYVSWCQRVMSWILAVDCPAQFLTIMNHYDSQKAQMAFDRRTAGWPRNPMLELERELAGDVAQQSMGLRHFVIFSPKSAGSDGVPYLSRLTRATKHVEATQQDAERALHAALRLTSSFGLEAAAADRDEIGSLLAQTVLGASSVAANREVLRIGDQYHDVLAVTKLPAHLEAGVILEAMMRARSRGLASLHIMPVEATVARKVINRQVQMHKYAIKNSSDTIDSEVALADAQSVLASIAQREMTPCRMALTLSVSHPDREKCDDALERLAGILHGHGFDVAHATAPGLLHALALSPGMAPLNRSLLLTSDDVALRMLPALGTPFADNAQPLVGTNLVTGSPAYFSVWTRPNHNMVIVGSSGAGKSVATKTLLARHVMEGVAAVVIDPDSEYRPIIKALGGDYFELGTEALNPFAAGVGKPADQAASLVLPILSVMGGDEKGVKDGRPIRRLPDEDQGWLHAELADFYRRWAADHGDEEPVMHNVIEFLETESRARALTATEAERCRIITARLRRFTQGKRAAVFDRPSTFAVGTKPVAIGLKVFAMAYGADLTPALAVVLTSILAAIDRREGRMIVVVDEAHRVTSDPDAGEVLGQLVRQVRKYGAGVWMCSQRVDDFVSTDLGRTLAATASTKLILGTEEASVEQVGEVFKLTREELASINPILQGRGVLISGAERSVVRVVPGTAIMALSDTSTALSAVYNTAPQRLAS